FHVCLVTLSVTLYVFRRFSTVTATTEIYTLSLHDALPISRRTHSLLARRLAAGLTLCLGLPGGLLLTACSGTKAAGPAAPGTPVDRKSTRLNSSHGSISYAVFCLKKKKIIKTITHHEYDYT